MVQKEHLTPVHLIPADVDDPCGLCAFAEEARRFLASHQWCVQVTRGYLGLGLPGILGVFLFEIVPRRPEIDPELWVVVGDLPPAYLVTDEAAEPLRALEAYVREMRRWVDAVERSKPLDHIIPVKAAPTSDNAAELAERLDFIESEILNKE